MEDGSLAPEATAHRVRGRKSSDRVVPKTTITRGKVAEKQAESASFYGRDRSTEKQGILSKIASLPSPQSLPEFPLVLENMCGRDGAMAED